MVVFHSYVIYQKVKKSPKPQVSQQGRLFWKHWRLFFQKAHLSNQPQRPPFKSTLDLAKHTNSKRVSYIYIIIYISVCACEELRPQCMFLCLLVIYDVLSCESRSVDPKKRENPGIVPFENPQVVDWPSLFTPPVIRRSGPTGASSSSASRRFQRFHGFQVEALKKYVCSRWVWWKKYWKKGCRWKKIFLRNANVRSHSNAMLTSGAAFFLFGA